MHVSLLAWPAYLMMWVHVVACWILGDQVDRSRGGPCPYRFIDVKVQYNVLEGPSGTIGNNIHHSRYLESISAVNGAKSVDCLGVEKRI